MQTAAITTTARHRYRLRLFRRCRLRPLLRLFFVPVMFLFKPLSIRPLFQSLISLSTFKKNV